MNDKGNSIILNMNRGREIKIENYVNIRYDIRLYLVN